MEQKPAFVEVTYKDDGPSFAGACAGSVQRAEVIEVRAVTPTEAERIACESIRSNPMAGGVRARFLRWA